MSYYVNAEKISLNDLQKRIEESDLVPSRSCLLENINGYFARLKEKGFVTFADLRSALINAKNIPSVSEKTGIPSEYLTLLRREIESYFPKAFPIQSFNWLPRKDLEKLTRQGYKNTALLYDALNPSDNREKIQSSLGINRQVIDELSCLVNLTRIQWTNPTAAKMLLSAGYYDAQSVSEADADIMHNKLNEINKGNNYFNGTIGLRDIKRWIKAASYVF